MEEVFYFILWAGAFFLMMRLGCGSHIAGHSSHAGPGKNMPPNETLRWIPPKMDKDPVCGKTVTTATAKSSIYDGAVYYFCSRECREQFEAAPDLYLDKATSQTGRDDTQKTMEQSHV